MNEFLLLFIYRNEESISETRFATFVSLVCVVSNTLSFAYLSIELRSSESAPSPAFQRLGLKKQFEFLYIFSY